MPEKCFYDISNVKKQDKFEYPDFFARFYDIIYGKIRSGVDYEYYLRQILNRKGNILEIGVGTGRLFISALEKGADIYGIDVSPSMVQILRMKLKDEYHNRVFVKDITELNLGLKFDLIIAPFRTFMHILDTDLQLKALNNIYDHLETNGTFIFDVFVPDLAMLLNGVDEIVDFEGEYEKGRKLKRIYSMSSDLTSQTSNILFRFEWDEEDGQKSAEWRTVMRYYFRYELENLVRLSKLRLVNIYGDFNESELGPESKDFVVVCKKDLLKI